MPTYTPQAMRAAQNTVAMTAATSSLAAADPAFVKKCAAIISEETGDARLRKALADVMLVCGSTGDAFEDFEEQAAAFQRETGKMRPGKDVPAAAGDLGATHEEYSTWVQSKLTKARAALAATEEPNNG